MRRHLSSRQAVAELKRLVHTRAAEQTIHRHLEKHPHLLVAPHYARPPVLLSKPPLGADFIPDFAFFWEHSGGQFVEFVEIEPPGLSIFTAKDEFSKPFDHAIQQLSDWLGWTKRHPAEITRFTEILVDQGFTTEGASYQYVQTRLIVGRRADVQANTRRKERWQDRQDELRGERTVRTWDGFIESLPLAALDSYDNWRSIRCYKYRAGRFVETGT